MHRSTATRRRFPGTQSLKIDGQAQFHPTAYVRRLASAIAGENCRVFEHSPVISFDGAAASLRTATGEVAAGYIVMATHTPKGLDVLHTGLGPYREYAIAARLDGKPFPEGIFWTMESPGHSVRVSCATEARDLIVIGGLHKTGQPEPHADYFAEVETYARMHFNVTTVDYRWSAQHYRPADGLPYIGPSIGSENVFVATGFGASGLLYGTVAASIIADAIRRLPGEWDDLYKTRRFMPAKSAGAFLKENINVARQYVADHARKEDSDAYADIGPGDGRIVTLGGEKTAVCRDAQGA